MAIAAGSGCSLALRSNGTVVAWGDSCITDVPPDLTDVIRIAVGGLNCLALRRDGTVVAWGAETIVNQVPENLTDVTAIACTGSAAIAVRLDGTVVAWGADGGLGGSNDTLGVTNLPPDLGDIVEVSAWSQSAIARRRDGSFVGWGENYLYQTVLPPFHTDVVSLGTGGGGSGHLFVDRSGSMVGTGFYHGVRPPALSNVVFVAQGGDASGGAYDYLALLGDGRVVAWGDNLQGQSTVPEGLSNVVAVSAGKAHSVALRADGRVIAWGDNTFGQTNVPPGLEGVKSISAGGHSTIALRSNGTMVAWGNPIANQPALSDVKEVSVGAGFALALRNNGRVVAWGQNNSAGQTNVPANLSNVVAIAAGWFQCVALKDDGKVVVWGANAPERGGPYQAVAATLKNVVAISTSGNLSYALVLDPKLSTIRRDGSNVVLGFRSFLGQAYQIQYSTDLTPNNWFNLPGGNVTGTGANLEVTDSTVIPGQPQRFYRLVEVN